MNTAQAREEIPFTGKRIRYESALSYDEVVGHLAKKIGKTVPPEKLASMGTTKEQYEATVKSNLGPSGFMSMAKLEYLEFLKLYGIPRRALRWMIGNPLIAITMLRQDVSAALFVPVEILVLEEPGNKSSVTFILPSSQIAIGKNDELKAAAEKLDSKLEDLISTSIK